MENGAGPLGRLPRIREGVRSRRESSWDRTGGNADFRPIGAGKTLALADLEGPGRISHIWVTISAHSDQYHLRNLVLRIFWDEEKVPSVESPIGDFFGACHCVYKNFASLPLAASPQNGRALNSFFSMPFARRARVEVENRNDQDVRSLYYYIDYEKHDRWDAANGYFHAWWNRQNPTPGDGSLEGVNLDDKNNYLILDAAGKGHYVGCVMGIDNRTPWWYGEGDDMIFIDGEKFPPSLHGTGTEDYFNTAFCPREEFSAPYHGAIMVPRRESAKPEWEQEWGANSWLGKCSMYRFHIEDPVVFRKSIRVSIEHGHANGLANDYTSVAYWYQTEPHKPFPRLPAPEACRPLRSVTFNEIHDWKRAYELQQKRAAAKKRKK